MKIYKYQIPKPNYENIALISLPENAEPLSVGMQNDEMVLWARVPHEHAQSVEISFIVVNTGNKYPYSMGRFLGTVISTTGVVWHILLYGRM